MYSMIL